MTSRVDIGKIYEAIANLNSSDRVAYIANEIIALEDEKKSIGADIKTLYAIAKACGFEVGAMRNAIKRSRDPNSADEKDAATRTYLAALKPKPQPEPHHEPQPRG